MANDELEIELIPGPDDAELETLEYQGELQRFEEALKKEGLDVAARTLTRKGAGFSSTLMGEFFIALQSLKNAGPFITIVVAWTAGRSTRKVRLKVGDIEVEAHTKAEVLELVEKAQQIQKDNVAPKIQMP